MRFYMPILCAGLAAAQPSGTETFAKTIRPVLMENCASCHSPNNPKNKAAFLRAQTAEDVAKERGVWRKVSQHIRNRTMPPIASKITEDQRLLVSGWVDDNLRATACLAGEQAGSMTLRRLNRREYRNTIRDLFGIEFAVEELFPADGSGGEGFDNNGETLFLPPILMERYLEAARVILDRVIITPSFSKTLMGYEIDPVRFTSKSKSTVIAPGEEVMANVTVFADGMYDIGVVIDRPRDRPKDMFVTVDSTKPAKLAFLKDQNGGPTSRSTNMRLARGPHKIMVKAGEFPIDFFSIRVEQRQTEAPPEKRVAFFRLFGVEPGEQPANRRAAAGQLIKTFLPRAFRRPVTSTEASKFVALYDRAAERGEPYEEGVKLALKGVLLAPDFLFKLEQEPTKPGLAPINDYELATRLSYFLWATMPDDQLFTLASLGKLHEPEMLLKQVDRMIDDPRSRSFTSTFINQWLGTKEIGASAAPIVASLQHFYTPDTAVDLREEPVLLFDYIVRENRNLLEILTADYTFLNARLVKYYELDGKVNVSGNAFQKVTWPDPNRAGVLGMGSVLALTSHFQQTSPVLRGAWILDNILGIPAPPPPPDVPPLEPGGKKIKTMTERQKLEKHRSDPACSACHNLIDPLGFGLENFDFMGRWRTEDNGHPVDARGQLPTGESFRGPIELRNILLTRKDDFIRRVTGKAMGYALGRSLEDADHCTIQHLGEKLEKDGYRARTLIKEIVMSAPFRYRSPGINKELAPPAITRRPQRKEP